MDRTLISLTLHSHKPKAVGRCNTSCHIPRLPAGRNRQKWEILVPNANILVAEKIKKNIINGRQQNNSFFLREELSKAYGQKRICGPAVVHDHMLTHSALRSKVTVAVHCSYIKH